MNENPDKTEQLFFLRLPENVASELKKDLEEGMQLKNQLTVNVNPDMRHMIVCYRNQYFEGRLKDLPCIVEVLKTTDYQHFYKSGNCWKMLDCVPASEHTLAVCMPSGLPPDSPDHRISATTKQSKKIPLEKRYQYNHGLTPPLKNVRKRRFRKCIRNTEVDMIDNIAKEVHDMIRADLGAVNVDLEITWLDEKGTEVLPQTAAEKEQMDAAAAAAAASLKDQQSADAARESTLPTTDNGGLSAQRLDERFLFGEISDDSEEDHDSS